MLLRMHIAVPPVLFINQVHMEELTGLGHIMQRFIKLHCHKLRFVLMS